MNNLNNKNSKKEIDEMSKKILKWLKEEDIFKEQLQTEETYFQFLGMTPHSHNNIFAIAQPKINNDSVIIGNQLVISENHLDKLRKMSHIEKLNFWNDIKLGMVFTPLTFTIQPNENNPNTIVFQKDIFYDGISKNKLMEAISDSYRCVIYAQLKLNILLKDSSNNDSFPLYG